MNIWQGIKKIIKKESKPIDIWHYFLGNYRYKLYYSVFSRSKLRNLLYKLLRNHISQQIEYRIEWMDRECYDSGSCKICGCETTALQMCNKPCDKPCYPAMMNKYQWKEYQKGSAFKDKNGTWMKQFTKNGKPLLLKENNYGYYIPNNQY